MSDDDAKKVNKHKVAEYFKVNGDSIERLNTACPKCGPGTFMANHKDRKTCGTCGYVEKPSVEKAEE